MGEMSRREVVSLLVLRYLDRGERSPGVSVYESDGGVSTGPCKALWGMAFGGSAGKLLSRTIAPPLVAVCLDCFAFFRRRAMRLSWQLMQKMP